ncbi:MAG: YqaE/Pmp3 family membrane protein, partial [Phaeodactylibacter sp.]|nr:YqaE/Pmp3 family membrane protein [Phaeodactylibacter sp.]
ILLPPLAMGLYDGITNRFWISLLLTLLFYVPGLVYTLIIILGEN